MNHSCTCAAIVLICLSLFGCSKSPEPIDTAASGNRTAELWRFLNSFVGTDTVPTVAEIEEKFGKPDEPVEVEVGQAEPQVNDPVEAEPDELPGELPGEAGLSPA